MTHLNVKIQFEVRVANGVAIDVANDVQIYFRFNVLYIKIVHDKTKQLLGLLLTLHRNMRKRLALYELFPPDIFLCKVSNKPNNLLCFRFIIFDINRN